MEVIALTGASNVGKTTTINILYQLLLNRGFAQVTGHFRDLDPDFFDILEINGKKVGIFSIGDYVIGSESVKRLLNDLFKAGCYKAICACTNKPRIINAVKAYPVHHFITKTAQPLTSLRRISNGLDAQTIDKLV